MAIKNPNGVAERVSTFADKDDAALALEDMPTSSLSLMEAIDEERWEDARQIFNEMATTLADLNLFIKAKEQS